MKRHLRNYIVGLIGGYDYLKEQASYSPEYVYGQVSTSLAIFFKVHLIGAMAIACSFIMGMLNAWSVQGIAVLILLIAILVIIFGSSSKFLSPDRYQYFMSVKERLNEGVLKRLRNLSTIVFILNISVFIIEMLITSWVGNS